MSKLTVYSTSGTSVGDVDVSGVLPEDAQKGRQALHDAVVAELAASRAGSANTRNKGEVAGSNKKPWKQKGTGRARAGYRQSPVWRGGGAAFGPKPRDYSKKVNRKVGRLAFRRAFADKVAAGAVRVIEGFSIAAPKTRDMVNLVKAQGITGSALLLLGKTDVNVTLSARNAPRIAVTTVENASVAELTRYGTIMVERSGVEALLARLGNKSESC